MRCATSFGRLVTAATLIVLLLVASFGPASASGGVSGRAGGDMGPRPGLWRGSASALGIRAFVNTEPRALPVDDLVTLHLPDATTEWDHTGDARGRASSVFPGQTVVGLPDLLETFGVPGASEFLPTYPLTVFASPTEPEAATPDGSASTRIDPNVSIVATGNASVPGLIDALAPLMEVGAATAASRQAFDAEGTLVLDSEGGIAGLSILGGVVTVESVSVSSTVRVAEVGEPRAEADTTVTGVKIAGIAVGVTEEGIEVGGLVIPPGGLPEGFDPSGIAGTVNEVVRFFDLDLRTIGTTQDVEGRTGRASAIGLLISIRIPVDGPALPALPLDTLGPLDPNDLVGQLLPLPLPDLDLNVLYRSYVLEVVVGESQALGYADVRPALPALSPLAPSTPVGATTGGGTGPVGGGVPVIDETGPVPADAVASPGSSSRPTTGASTDTALVLLGSATADGVLVGFLSLAALALVQAVGLRRSLRRLRDGRRATH